MQYGWRIFPSQWNCKGLCFCCFGCCCACLRDCFCCCLCCAPDFCSLLPGSAISSFFWSLTRSPTSLWSFDLEDFRERAEGNTSKCGGSFICGGCGRSIGICFGTREAWDGSFSSSSMRRPVKLTLEVGLAIGDLDGFFSADLMDILESRAPTSPTTSLWWSKSMMLPSKLPRLPWCVGVQETFADNPSSANGKRCMTLHLHILYYIEKFHGVLNPFIPFIMHIFEVLKGTFLTSKGRSVRSSIHSSSSLLTE